MYLRRNLDISSYMELYKCNTNFLNTAPDFKVNMKIVAEVSPLEKREDELSLEKFKGTYAGHVGIEPTTLGFGDRCST